MKIYRLATAALAVFFCAIFAEIAIADQSSIVQPQTGPHTQADLQTNYLNPALRALLSNSSGSTAPVNGPGGAPMLGQLWLDTSTTPNTVRQYDGSSWVAQGTLNATTHVFTPVPNCVVPGLLKGNGTSPCTTAVAGGVDYISGTGTTGSLPLGQTLITGLVSPTLTTQGLYLNWNAESGGTGRADFINNQGVGSKGGFAWFNGTASVAPSLSGTPLATLSPNPFPAFSATPGASLVVSVPGWLEPIVAGTESVGPVIQGMSHTGSIGGLFATQSGFTGSNCVGCQGAFAVGTFGINNNDVGRQSVDSMYAEARRYGASGPTQVHESDVLNLGAVVDQQPYLMVPTDGTGPLGFTLAYGAACGRTDVAGNQPCSSAYTLNNNGSTFDKGIVFASNSITGATGAVGTGYGEAIVMSAGHALDWYSPASGNPLGARLASAVTTTGAGQQLIFTNGGFQILNQTAGTLYAQFGAINYMGTPLVTQASFTLSALVTSPPSGTKGGNLCYDTNKVAYGC